MEGESFGAVLRGHRLLAALSQEELSRRAQISVRTVRDLEAGRIGRPRPRTVGLLADVLELAGNDRRTFTATALSVAAPGNHRRCELPRTGPPQPLTPLIGRADELNRLCRTLSGPARLITVTGLGGVGKTKLALAAADRVDDGTDVAWVPLSGLADAAADVDYAVVDAVAQALGAPGAGLDGLPDVLAGTRTVLLLDACEHVPGIGAVIEELLRRCPGLTVLATSRCPVGAAGEYEHPLGPLVVPEPGAEADPAALAEVPAVRLLLDRISARRPEFALDPAGAVAVARLCRRLGGLPLALELAAAQCRVREPADLLAEPVGDHMRLRTAIAGSVALLDEPSARALARLSVFAGGWTLTSAAAVLDDVDVVSVHDTLIAHGVVGRDRDARFAMLDMIREHAAELATVDGGLADTAARHAAYYDRFVATTAADLETRLTLESLATLDAERDNIRVALDWCRRHDRVAGLRMVESLKHYWFMRSRYPEAAQWLTDLLPSARDRDAAHVACYSQGHRYAAVCWLAMGDRARAHDHARSALTCARRTGDPILVATARSALGRTLFYLGDPTAAERQLRAALIHSGHWAAVLSAAALADLLSARGEVAEARHIAEQARDSAIASGRTATLPWVWHALARVAWRAGDLAAVHAATAPMLELCDQLGDCPAIRLRALVYTAAAASAQGRVAEGLRLVSLTRRLAASAGPEDRALTRWARVEVALAAAQGVLDAAATALPEVATLGNRPYLIDVLSALALSTVDNCPTLAAQAIGLANTAATRHNVTPTSIARARLTTATQRARDLLGPDWAPTVHHGSTLSVPDLVAAM